MSEAGGFHLGEGWFDPWYAAYGTGRARRIAGLPLIDDFARLGPIGYRRRRSATNAHSARFDLAADKAPPADLAAALLDGADVVRLEYLPEDARLLALAARWPERHGAHVAVHALTPVADCRRPYAAWLAARSKRSRSRLNRLDAVVLGDLGMQFELLGGLPGLPAVMAEILAVEASGWKGEAGTAIRDDPADLGFYTALAERAAAAGALRIAVLRHDGRIVAFEFGVLGGRRLFLLKVGYDERFAELSIGHVLAARHIRLCCDDPAIDWYDKMGNGLTPASYKLRFADEVERLWRVTLYGRSWRARLVRAHDRARAAAKRWRDRRRGRREAEQRS